MIRLLEPGREADLLEAVGNDPLMGVGIEANFRVYGASGQIWLQYTEDKPSAAFLGSAAGRYQVAAGTNADLEELAAYLRACDFTSMVASPALCALLEDFGQRHGAPIMECTDEPLPADGGEIEEVIPLAVAYALLGEVNDWFVGENPFDEWYTFHSHLIRHGLGMVRGIFSEGVLASTATLTLSERYALISSVATRPACRGQGYAARLTRSLTGTALQLGRRPILYCGSEELSAYYAGLGFSTVGRFEEIDRT